jgi:hypothetical protein
VDQPSSTSRRGRKKKSGPDRRDPPVGVSLKTKGYPGFLAVRLKDHPTADIYLLRLIDTRATRNLASTGKKSGGWGPHRRAAGVDGEVAAGSQGVGGGPAAGTAPAASSSAGSSVTSFDGGAPRRGPTAALPANSAQGKGS